MKKTLCLILFLAAVCCFALNTFAAGLSFSDVKETWLTERAPIPPVKTVSIRMETSLLRRL